MAATYLLKNCDYGSYIFVEELCYNLITNTVKVCRVALFELTLKQLIPNCSDEKKLGYNCPLWVSGPMPRRPRKHLTSLPVWKEINLSRSIGWGRKFPNLINQHTWVWLNKKKSCCTCDTLFAVFFSRGLPNDVAIFSFITCPLISAGSHWIKLTSRYKIGWWLSDDSQCKPLNNRSLFYFR